MDRDPYEVYQENYCKVRQGVGASSEEVEDVLLEAVGERRQEIPEHLQAVYDFVRGAIEKKVSITWIMRAEAETQHILKYRQIITTVGKEVSAKVTLQSEGGRGLDKDLGDTVREKLALGIVGSILHAMEPKLVTLLSAEQFSPITVDIVNVRDDQCNATISGEWRHPGSGERIPIMGTATIDMGHLTKRGNGQ